MRCVRFAELREYARVDLQILKGLLSGTQYAPTVHG